MQVGDWKSIRRHFTLRPLISFGMHSKWFDTPQKSKYWPSMQLMWSVLRSEWETTWESPSDSAFTKFHQFWWLECKIRCSEISERIGQFSPAFCCQLKSAAVTSPFKGRFSTDPDFGGATAVADGSRSRSRQQCLENPTRWKRKSPQQEHGQSTEWNRSAEARGLKWAKIKSRAEIQTGSKRWWKQPDYRAVEFDGWEGIRSN